MKKLLFTLTVIITLAMSACGGASGPEDVYNKIQDNKELSQADYAVMIDYLQAAMKESTALIKEALTNPNTEELQQKAEKLAAKYPYMDTFASTLYLNANSLDEENDKAFMKVAEDMQKEFQSVTNYGM